METIDDDKEALPLFVPAVLSFVAGFVDSFTFLALFGLFVANVTGTFVIVGAEIVGHVPGVAAKLLAIIAFLLAAGLTAAFVAYARQSGRPALTWTLAIEAALLAAFAGLILAGAPITRPDDWGGVAAGLFAAMAMGAQSALVRLLLRGVPQTNVMTGNMTQLGVDATELVLAWGRLAREPTRAETTAELAAVRTRLCLVLSVGLGFLLGVVVGPVIYVAAGLRGALAPIVVIGALCVWALRRERRARIAR